MKPWEILKAVDEGKTVQWKYPYMTYWLDWDDMSLGRGEDEPFYLNGWKDYEWRIKPEPRVFKIWVKEGCRPVLALEDFLNKIVWEREGWQLIEATENVS